MKTTRWLNCIPPAAGLLLLLTGCVAPIGADRVTTRQAYAQVEANALRSGKPGADTVSILHRFDLDRLAATQPDEAVRQLHQKALTDGGRDLLFALAELSYVAGDHIHRGLKPWDPRDARDYYLGCAVYAHLFLFGEGKPPRPDAFDRRFRAACDLYNYGLARALGERRGTNAVVHMTSGRRRLPVGEIEVRFAGTNHGVRLDQYEQFLMTDQFRVRGLSTRNREAGLGAPLIAVGRMHPELGIRPASPVTAFLRAPASLAEAGAGGSACVLEVYSSYDDTTLDIAGTRVPLESDLTTYRAYVLNQSYVWRLGMLQFLSPTERIRSQLLLNQPYVPGRVPVVFVHGTFSSPVTWAELGNTLSSDPALHHRCQVWSYLYSSGKPLPVSALELREALVAKVKELDPEGRDPALRQMVVIGHSQGGLLAKLTATDTGDRIWRIYSTNRLEDLPISEPDRELLRGVFFVKPLPFVRRVVFISTPHCGSYLAGGFARRLARSLMSLPGYVVSRTREALTITEGSTAASFMKGKMPTSLDSMSPKNPGLLALAEIPVAPTIKAHSIIPVKGKGDVKYGRDGVVSYQSAHVAYVESECVVRAGHSCLDEPATIEEVRRILYEHLRTLK
jgi:pimeloyl-ACP methyl ester carboxylesterase